MNRLIRSLCAVCLVLGVSSHAAEPPSPRINVDLEDQYSLGVMKYRLDRHTRIIGWRVSHTVYFGQQRGDDSGLSLVWQQSANRQISLSRDGLRLTKRF